MPIVHDPPVTLTAPPRESVPLPVMLDPVPPRVSEPIVSSAEVSEPTSTVPSVIVRLPRSSEPPSRIWNLPSELIERDWPLPIWPPGEVTTAEFAAPMPSPMTRGPWIVGLPTWARASVPSSTFVVPV